MGAHKKKGNLICNVFPENSAFTVMLRMSNHQFAAVYEQLSEYAKEYIEELTASSKAAFYSKYGFCEMFCENKSVYFEKTVK